MSYRITDETEWYEVGIDFDEQGGVILAACKCGAGDLWPNKGLGRAHAATWRTRHQHLGENANGPEGHREAARPGEGKP